MRRPTNGVAYGWLQLPAVADPQLPPRLLLFLLLLQVAVPGEDARLRPPVLPRSLAADWSGFLIPAPKELSKKIEMYLPEFYATCTFGGILSCGLSLILIA
ncbi:hypothetical protein NL676_035503 [Syzygium grande]|nr:hypothetical protein NL676_035503 [Syzygium grande]